MVKHIKFYNDYKKSLVFYPVPKNANTSAKYFLIKHTGNENKYRKPLDISKYPVGTKHDVDNSLPKVSNFLPTKQRFKVVDADERAVIIRNPITRFVSAYTNKVLHKKTCYIGLTVDQVLTELENGVFLDKHFFSQNYFIGSDLSYYTIIGKLENLKPFIDGINHFFGKKIDFPKVYSGSSDKKIDLSKKQIKRIKRIYIKDMEIYNGC